MQIFVATLLAVLPFASALPAAQNSTVCTNGYDSYDACLSDVMCVDSFPASCRCENARKTLCGEACNVEPTLQICVKLGPGPVDICVSKCMGQTMCPETVVDGCECHNNVLTDCRKQCGETPPTADQLQDCNVDDI